MQWVECDDKEADTVADRAVESVADSDREEETDSVTQTVLDCDSDNVGAWSDSRTWTHQR